MIRVSVEGDRFVTFIYGITVDWQVQRPTISAPRDKGQMVHDVFNWVKSRAGVRQQSESCWLGALLRKNILY